MLSRFSYNEKKGKKFLSAANRRLIDNSADKNASTIESQPGGRTGQRRCTNKGQILPFMFYILVIINQEVEGKDSQSILGYDCSSPRDLKIWDASTRCKDKSERKLEDQERDGGAPGCVGSLHTYALSPPKTECEFREIRSVKGKIGKFDFLAEKEM